MRPIALREIVHHGFGTQLDVRVGGDQARCLHVHDCSFHEQGT
jgi:hypothetical protein